MKIVAGVIVLLLAIAGFTTFIYSQTVEMAEMLTGGLVELEEKIEREKWEDARAEVATLKEDWQRVDMWWTPFMDHREIDALDQTMVRVERLVDMEQKEDALVEVLVAISMVQRIKDREGPNIKNVFLVGVIYK